MPSTADDAETDDDASYDRILEDLGIDLVHARDASDPDVSRLEQIAIYEDISSAVLLRAAWVPIAEDDAERDLLDGGGVRTLGRVG